jgi:hypothetical protein
LLAAITIGYNIVEGLVSTWFGLADETFALFGFGLDSFIEVISGIGIWHMIWRLRVTGAENRDPFEKRALRITGISFYLLALILAVTAVSNIWEGHQPETTMWGIIVSSISIGSMWLLIHFKVKVGKALSSSAILADAACTRTCLWLSVILLVASVAYELTGIGVIDSLGSLGIAWLSLKEGKEAMEKASGESCACS